MKSVILSAIQQAWKSTTRLIRPEGDFAHTTEVHEQYLSDLDRYSVGSALDPANGESLEEALDFACDQELTYFALRGVQLAEGDQDLQCLLEADMRALADSKTLVVNEKKNNARYNVPVLARWGAVSFIFVTALGSAVYYFIAAPKTYEYSSPMGEQLPLVLADGSKLNLNSNSRLTFEFGRRVRKVFLHQGEVFFDVVVDKEREFLVYAKKGVTRVVGTQFNIDMGQGDDVVVSVISGVVEVESHTENEQGDKAKVKSLLGKSTLVQGQAASYSESAHRELDADLNRIHAWQEGTIKFDRQPLSDVVEEFNRYSKKSIVIADKRLEGIEISGVFQIGDTEKLFSSLKQMFEMVVTEEDELILITSQKSDYK